MPRMDEGHKRVLLIAASILAARRLAKLDFKPCLASEAVIASAIATGGKILRRIDPRWPARESREGP